MEEIRKVKLLRGVLTVLFVVYLLALFRFTLFKYAPLSDLGSAFFLKDRQVSLIPFKNAYTMIQNMSPVRLVENFAGNVLLFLPFGLMLPLISGFDRESVAYGLILSFFIEVMQYAFAMGFSDIDDLILNTLGTFIGWAIYLFISKRFKDYTHFMIFMAVVLTIGAAVSFAVLYKAGILVDGFPNIVL